jgi:RimJ/RimL family protein N-acetyltransferase
LEDRSLFVTRRLTVRPAAPDDAVFIHRLWTCPEVMKLVGFPQGLSCTLKEVQRQIETTQGRAFGGLLIVERRQDSRPIGQAHLSEPGVDGVCEPDIKLDPLVWGNGYGKELWPALVAHAFEHSDASVVQGTPNRENAASVRIQCAAGLRKVGEGIFAEQVQGRADAIPVPFVKLQISRERWQAGRDTRDRDRERRRS